MVSLAVDRKNPLCYSIGSRLRLPYFFDAISDLPDSAICLDLGSGTGFFSVILANLRHKVYAVDPDQLSLDKGRELYTDVNIIFLNGCAEKIPLADNSVDFVVCSEVLEHVTDQRQALAELKRVSRPGAGFFLTVPARGVFGNFFLRIGHDEGNEFEYHSHPLFDRKTIVGLLTENGLKIEKCFYSKFIVAEVFMGLTKLAHNLKKKKEISGQHDILMPPLVYKLIFPLVLGLSRLEDWLLRHSCLPGHMIVAYGKIEK